MKKRIRFLGAYLALCFYHRFKIIGSVKEAEERGLKFAHNVHGDPINWLNCRSFWYDKHDLMYRCAELYDTDNR